MFDRRPTDVLRTSYHLVPWTSSNWVARNSHGRHRSELLNICSSCKKQKQICNTRTITSEKQFFQKIINFCIGSLRVPCSLPCRFYFSTFREPSGDVPGWPCAGWVFPMIIFSTVLCIPPK